MKQNLYIKSLLIALLVLFGGGGVSAQETKTLKYEVSSTSSVSLSSGTLPDGVAVSYSSTYNTTNQLTSGNSMTLTLSKFPFPVSSVTLNLRTNKNAGQGNLNVKHNNVQIHWTENLTPSPVPVGNTYNEYTFNVEDTQTSGDLVITLAATTNSVYCNAFTISYLDNSSATGTEDPQNSFAVSEDNATIGEPYTMPEFTTSSDGAKSYTSSDTDVATINSSGVITLIKKGTTTITVTTAQTATYAQGSASYTLHVAKGNPVLSFAQETVTAYLGTDQAGPLLTNPGDGTVTYEISDPSIATIQSNGYIQPIAAGTATVTATAAETEAWYSATASYTLKVEETFSIDAVGKYEWVTDATTLKDGDQILISYISSSSSGSVLGEKQTNNFDAKSLNYGAISEDKSTFEVTAEKVTAAILEGSKDAWYFHVNGGYLCASSSSSNYLGVKTLSSAGDNAKATINISNGNATITFQGNYTRNLLKYNSSNTLFSCYNSSSDMKLVQLYRKIDSQTLPKVPISFDESLVEITYGDNYDKQKATADGYSGDLVYTSSDESIVKFHGNNVIDVLGPGTVTITATAPATEMTSESSATYTLKIYEPTDAVEGSTLALDEHFNDCVSSRPDPDNLGDKGWNGTNQFKALPETCNWTVNGTSSPAGNGCLKLGTGTNAGDATSPSFTLNGTAPLQFDIAPWTSASDGSITGSKSVTVTLTNATFEDGSTTKTVGNPFTIGWNHFEYDITGSGDVTINFHGSSQFFLDNVVVGTSAQPAHEINLTFSSAGYLTWVATADIDFSQTEGVTAYKITEATSKKITMVEVDKVPTGAAVMLKGSGTVTLTRTTGVEAFTDNVMKACTDASVTGNGVNGVNQTDVYVLGNGKSGLGFYMLKGTLQAGKGYLKVSEEGNAKDFIGFEITTGVKTIEIKDFGDAAIYNLQGIRVAHPQKGIYVKNGKKYVIK